MMTKSSDHSIIFFDGFCQLCSGSVQFVLRRDMKEKFWFAPLQSEKATLFSKLYSIDNFSNDTIILIEEGEIYTQSTAILRICKNLHLPWNILWGFMIVPRFIRDPIYSWIARNRFRVFRKREVCFVPEEKWKERFL